MHVIEKIRGFFARPFVQRTAALQVGFFAANFVQALAGVFIARILAPERFGIYALAFSVASVTSVLLAGGFQEALAPIVTRAWVRKDSNALLGAYAFWVKILGISIFLTCVALVALPLITAFAYHDIDIGKYAAFVVMASVLSTTIFSFVSLALQVTGRIALLSLLVFIDTVVRYGLSLGLIVAGYGIGGAVAGQFVGALFVLILSVRTWSVLKRRESLMPSIGRVLRASWAAPLKPFLRSSIMVAVDRNVAMLYNALPVALVGLFAVATHVAYFKLAFGFVNLGLSMLGPVSLLLNVEFPRMQVIDASRLRHNFIRVSCYGIAASCLLTAGALIVSPLAFRILYGDIYLPSIPYIFGLGLYGALFGIGIGLGPLWRSIDRVHVSIIINLIVLGVGIPLGLGLMQWWGLWGAVVMVTLWYTASHIISFWYLLRHVDRGPTVATTS